MLKNISDIFSMMKEQQLEDLYFNANPDMIPFVSEVKMDFIVCPSCKEQNLRAWIYKRDGQWLQDPVQRICPECAQEEFSKQVTGQLITKRKRVLERDWYFIDPYDESGFKNFEAATSEVEAAKNKAIAYVKAITNGTIGNLRIAGTTGTGKTHLAKAIARTAKHEGMNVAFIEAASLFGKIKKTFGNDHERQRLEDHFARFDLMVIDDVGVETKRRDEVSWTSSEWVRLIDLRKDKSTVYTTNFDEAALADVIGARAESRMSHNSDKIKLFTPGQDYRKRA